MVKRLSIYVEKNMVLCYTRNHYRAQINGK